MITKVGLIRDLKADGTITDGKLGNTTVMVSDEVKVPDFIAGVWYAMN